MQRFIDQALAHLQLIHKELKTAGYRFLAKQPVQLANKDAEQQIETLEKEIGPLPLTLRVWLLTVGAVDLRGQLDDWGTCHAEFLAKGERAEIIRTDALMVCSLADAFDELDNWNEEQPFEFPQELNEELDHVFDPPCAAPSGLGPYCQGDMGR